MSRGAVGQQQLHTAVGAVGGDGGGMQLLVLREVAKKTCLASGRQDQGCGGQKASLASGQSPGKEATAVCVCLCVCVKMESAVAATLQAIFLKLSEVCGGGLAWGRSGNGQRAVSGGFPF